MHRSIEPAFAPMGWNVLLVLAAAMSPLAGCVVEASDCSGDNSDCTDCGDAGSGGSGGSTQAPQVVLATIDTDETLESEAGKGIGVFIEYAQGGHWHVFTACDTDLSGLPCELNVIATAPKGVTIQSAAGEALESTDDVYDYGDEVEMAAITRSDFDGMTFDTPQGATMRFEVYLDGLSEGRFTYWVGGGALHGGAPSNPIDLAPSSD